jgi:superfamily II DNA or RNA helicase
MNKVKVASIRIAEKIYISKIGLEDTSSLLAAYTYNNGEEFLSTIEETDDCFLVPSNSYHKLSWDTLIDDRNFSHLDHKISFSGKLRAEQQEAVNKFFIGERARSGLLQAKPGWGKTFAACSLVARNNSKTLILVHTKLLFEQWLKELNQQIPDITPGKIGNGLFSIQDVTVAIYKTAYNNIDQLRDQFSTLLVDEAHKCPADMFSSVVNNINAKVKIAITATPRRKDGKHVYLEDFFSPFKVVAEDSRSLAIPSATVVTTDFKFGIVDPKRDWSRAMNKLCADKDYQQLIANKAISYIKQGRCPLIIGDRVQMLKDLQKLIPDSICVIGESDNEAREDALANLGKTYKAILTTKLFDEGISCHRLDTLFFTCPSNNPVQWEQRIGRIERLHPDKQFPLIVDFWLSGKVVARQQQARILWYKSRGYNII